MGKNEKNIHEIITEWKTKLNCVTSFGKTTHVVFFPSALLISAESFMEILFG